MTEGAFIVAIDGPAAAGKGTISKAVAQRYGFGHLDTGLLYRAVGVVAAEIGGDPVDAAQRLSEEALARSDLRTAAAAQAASKVAVIPEVRSALLDFQRRFATRPGGAVLDGRDIGTVICPEADVKLFVTASAQVRAHRRHKELSEKGDARNFDEVLADVVARDERDASRDAAPMAQAGDAHLIDTSEMSIEDAVEAAVTIIAASR
ncbi:MAG: d(CMP) kinase [Pseudomonadota bacterium]